MTEGTDERRMRLIAVLPWALIAVVMVVLAAVAVVRLFVDGPETSDDAASVQDVADLTVEVTEALDIAGGVDLLCEQPMDLYRMTVESTVVRWQSESGSDLPSVQAEASDVDEGSSGSFVIRISSDEPGLEDEQQAFRVFVEDRAGRSCVTGVGGVDSTRQTTRFSGGGYSPVTSPTPSPRSSPGATQTAP